MIHGIIMYVIMTCGIYKLTTPTGKIYIGQSCNIEHRWNEHRLEANKIQANFKNKRLTNMTRLRGSFKKYKWIDMSKEILEVCDPKQLDNLEIHYIKLYDSFNNGLNCTTGGGQYFIRGTDTLAKMKLINLGKYGGKQSIPFFIDGKRYVSILEASVDTKIPSKTIHNRLNSNNIKYSNYIYEDKTKVPARKKQMYRNIQIEINGISYDSGSDASRELGIPVVTLFRRARSTSKKFSNYRLITQQ